MSSTWKGLCPRLLPAGCTAPTHSTHCKTRLSARSTAQAAALANRPTSGTGTATNLRDRTAKENWRSRRRPTSTRTGFLPILGLLAEAQEPLGEPAAALCRAWEQGLCGHQVDSTLMPGACWLLWNRTPLWGLVTPGDIRGSGQKDSEKMAGGRGDDRSCYPLAPPSWMALSL